MTKKRKHSREERPLAIFGRVEDLDVDEFNRRYWAERSDEDKMDVAWQLVEQAWEVKGRDPRELRLQRSFMFFKPA